MSVLVAVGPIGTGQRAQEVSDVLDFTTPPPGMLGLDTFTLAALDDSGLLFTLRSTSEPGVRLFAVAPQSYFPGYAPRLDDETRAALGLGDEDPVLLAVVHPGEGTQPPTANLLAPVAVNAATGTAVQVVLDGDEWPLRAPFAA